MELRWGPITIVIDDEGDEGDPAQLLIALAAMLIRAAAEIDGGDASDNDDATGA